MQGGVRSAERGVLRVRRSERARATTPQMGLFQRPVGADQDAWAEGVGLGMAGQNTAAYVATAPGTGAAYRRMAESTATWMASQAKTSDHFWEADWS